MSLHTYSRTLNKSYFYLRASSCLTYLFMKSAFSLEYVFMFSDSQYPQDKSQDFFNVPLDPILKQNFSHLALLQGKARVKLGDVAKLSHPFSQPMPKFCPRGGQQLKILPMMGPLPHSGGKKEKTSRDESCIECGTYTSIVISEGVN